MVDTQGAGAVAIQGVEADEAAIGGFVQGVTAEQALTILDGGGVIAGVLEEVDQALQGGNVCLAEGFPVGDDPIIVATGEEVARVELDEACQGAAGGGGIAREAYHGEGGFEFGHVEGERGGGTPLDGIGGGIQVGVGAGEGVAEEVEQVAQVGARLGFGGIRPEEVGEAGAGLGGVAVEEEVSEEGLEARGINLRDGCVVVAYAEIAQQRDGQQWGHFLSPHLEQGRCDRSMRILLQERRDIWDLRFGNCD